MALISRVNIPQYAIRCSELSRSMIPLLRLQQINSFLPSGEHLTYDENGNIRIENKLSAKLYIKHLNITERKRLRNAIMSHVVDRDKPCTEVISLSQMKKLFYANAIPLIGFGFLDNALMIVAGEYLDQTLGAIMAISTMAAAGLGHIIADLAGMALTHYVEFTASKVGIQQPFLTPAQRDSPCVRKLVNFARATGLIVGCVIGMLPLIFYKNPKAERLLKE